MKFNFNPKYRYPHYFGSISYRTALLSWLLIIISLMTFVIFTVPFQRQDALERMKIEANDIANSLIHANSKALITEEFGYAVEHTRALVEESASLEYVIYTRKDGFSIIFTKNGWYTDSLGGIFTPSAGEESNKIIDSDIIKQRIFNHSIKFVYSGFEWGWVHTGSSLNSFNKNLTNFTIRTVFIAITLVILSFLASIFFSRKLTKPITTLDKNVKEIADGNLEVVSEIKTGDELESLSNSFNKMTLALRESRDKLELRVKERTKELAQTNSALINEVQERIKVENSLNRYTLRLEAMQDIYRGIISAKSTHEVIIETLNNLKNKLVKFKRASVALYDFNTLKMVVHSITQDKESYISKSVEMDQYVLDPNKKFSGRKYIYKTDLDSEKSISELELEIKNLGIKSFVTVPLKFQGKFIGELNFGSSSPKAFNENNLSFIEEIGFQISVAIAQKKLEEQLEFHAKNLQSSLKEKEVLLKEIHHRVKNNLQIISSLLYLQSRKISDEETMRTFLDSQNRVRSMALVHEKLYQSKDLSSVNFSEYIKNLSSYIANSFNSDSRKIRIIYNFEEIHLSIEKAVPLGLILNELLSNCYKYAFPNSQQLNKSNENTIKISFNLVKESDRINFSVKDNGVGIPKDLVVLESDTLGLQLVNNLVDQLEADLTINNSDGTEFNISFLHQKK
ncbi:MAG: hypothetical protein CVV23_00625 [Ignavibacteriae bacterium HGW-Ignavibacteriae-2]|jgi:two-component sensor histidine kinase|nr:MAG: hypothetical protein CVV23_00625 [Ignavibacteriae bacterium HGW-Ignavibacteriae-2]